MHACRAGVGLGLVLSTACPGGSDSGDGSPSSDGPASTSATAANETGDPTGDPTDDSPTGPGESGESGESGGSMCPQPSPPGPGVDACENAGNPGGPQVDVEWPAAVNFGHDAVEGQTLHFHWEGAHNVLQVASFLGQEAPLDPFASAGWPGQISSGAKTDPGVFDWNVGAYPCGYRPGIYFFVDEGNPAAGITSATITVDEFANDHYAPRPCSALADPAVHGGRYAGLAGRPDCTMYEVNNFQTLAHFDWVPPTFGAQLGDLILFRWTGEHNVIQVHNTTEDLARDDWACPGIASGPKTNCVGGPHYSCVNGDASLGEFMIDTANYRPGIVHLSDECIMTCTGSPTGMNFQVGLHRAVRPSVPVAGSCCALPEYAHLGADCRVVDVWNDYDGAHFDYNVAVGRADVIRFRWSGDVRIYQSLPASPDGTPGPEPRPGGAAMAESVDCTPGPGMTCLQGNTDAAQFMFDVAAARHEVFPTMQPYFDFWAEGEDIEGYSSASHGTLFYVDDSVPHDLAHACP